MEKHLLQIIISASSQLSFKLYISKIYLKLYSWWQYSLITSLPGNGWCHWRGHHQKACKIRRVVHTGIVQYLVLPIMADHTNEYEYIQMSMSTFSYLTVYFVLQEQLYKTTIFQKNYLNTKKYSSVGFYWFF